MASPAMQAEKSGKLGATAGSMGMGSTMAGTKRATMSGDNSLNNTLNMTKMNTFGGSYTSPFRDTVARGMLTGVGLLGK
jgi:hypothetical protein